MDLHDSPAGAIFWAEAGAGLGACVELIIWNQELGRAGVARPAARAA